MDKIHIADELLTSYKEDLELYKGLLYSADKKYMGGELDRQIQSYNRRINEIKVEIEALEEFIKGQEYKLNGDAPY